MVKKIKHILIASFLIFNFLFNKLSWAGVTVQESFLEANQFCKAGEYVKALDIYEKINHKGSVVWYNIGNCYFYQKKFPKALWAWLHACKGGDQNVIINSKYNINVTQNLLDIKAQADYYPEVDFLIWQLLVLLIVYGLFLILIKKNNGKRGLQWLLFFIEIGIFGTTFWYNKELKLRYAVVQHEANLFAGPNAHYHDLGHLVGGQIVKVLKHDADWCYVKDKQVRGWLAKDNLLVI